jgi:hypothetical protein
MPGELRPPLSREPALEETHITRRDRDFLDGFTTINDGFATEICRNGRSAV